MGFDPTESRAALSGPHEHRGVITASDEPTSIMAEHDRIYD